MRGVPKQPTFLWVCVTLPKHHAGVHKQEGDVTGGEEKKTLWTCSGNDGVSPVEHGHVDNICAGERELRVFRFGDTDGR